MSDFGRIDYLPFILGLVNVELSQKVTVGGLQKPAAYVEIIDTDSTVISISTCTEFKVTSGIGDIYGKFSCTLDKGSSWNLLGATEKLKLEPDLRRRVKIYYGQRLSTGFNYELVFEGIPMLKPESYRTGAEDKITIEGFNLCYILSKLDGVYETSNYTGNSLDLIEYWTNEASLTSYISYDDFIEYDEQSIDYDTMSSGIGVIANILGPSIEYWGSHDGTFFMKKISFDKNDTSNIAEIEYTGATIEKLSFTDKGDRIITSAAVYGYEDMLVEGSASQELIDRYGDELQTINSELIPSEAIANSLIEDILFYGLKERYGIKFEAILNPYLRAGQIISVTDDSLTYLNEQKVLVYKLSHSYKAGRYHKSSVTGYMLYE
jgi:hypothetical protein